MKLNIFPLIVPLKPSRMKKAIIMTARPSAMLVIATLLIVPLKVSSSGLLILLEIKNGRFKNMANFELTRK